MPHSPGMVRTRFSAKLVPFIHIHARSPVRAFAGRRLVCGTSPRQYVGGSRRPDGCVAGGREGHPQGYRWEGGKARPRASAARARANGGDRRVWVGARGGRGRRPGQSESAPDRAEATRPPLRAVDSGVLARTRVRPGGKRCAAGVMTTTAVPTTLVRACGP